MKATRTSYDKGLLGTALGAIDSALSKTQISREPFPHFAISALFDDATASALLQWMETDAPWSAESRGFYIQHGCHHLSQLLASHPAGVVGAPETLQLIKEHLERLFGVELKSDHFELGAHRLLKGHRIGPHNDDPSGGTENYRLVVNLNSGFHEACGGHLALYDRNNPTESLVIVSPWHNSAVAMEFSDHSWHSVDEVKHGTRYSLLYSFWKSGRTEQPVVPVPGPRIPGEKHFRRLYELLRVFGADAIPHSNGFLMDHLIGTCLILQSWQSDWDICKAGLFHSIADAGNERRNTLRATLGERSLFLIRLYQSLDDPALDQLLFQRDFWENGVLVRVHEQDLRAVVVLAWASILEKARRLPAPGAEQKRLRALYEKTKELMSEATERDVAALLNTA